MSTIRLVFFCWVMAVSFGCGEPAEGSVRVTGTAMYKTARLAHVRVVFSLASEGNALAHIVHTDKSGRFAAVLPHKGVYHVTADHPVSNGYFSKSRAFAFLLSDTVELGRVDLLFYKQWSMSPDSQQFSSLINE
jgi:hypothetical protein